MLIRTRTEPQDTPDLYFKEKRRGWSMLTKVGRTNENFEVEFLSMLIAITLVVNQIINLPIYVRCSLFFPHFTHKKNGRFFVSNLLK